MLRVGRRLTISCITRSEEGPNVKTRRAVDGRHQFAVVRMRVDGLLIDDVDFLQSLQVPVGQLQLLHLQQQRVKIVAIVTCCLSSCFWCDGVKSLREHLLEIILIDPHVTHLDEPVLNSRLDDRPQRLNRVELWRVARHPDDLDVVEVAVGANVESLVSSEPQNPKTPTLLK